jgi:ABC-type antimicrobial peptide transport system ATPase subunit
MYYKREFVSEAKKKRTLFQNSKQLLQPRFNVSPLRDLGFVRLETALAESDGDFRLKTVLAMSRIVGIAFPINMLVCILKAVKL